MGDVSEYDDEADRPDSDRGSDRGGDGHGDMGDTQPLGGSSYPPPLPSHPEPQREPADQLQQPQAPGPYGQPFGQPPTSSYTTQPQPNYGYAPYAPQPGPQPRAVGGRGG